MIYFLRRYFNRGWHKGLPVVDGNYLVMETVIYKDDKYHRYSIAHFSDGKFLDDYADEVSVTLWKRIIAPRVVP